LNAEWGLSLESNDIPHAEEPPEAAACSRAKDPDLDKFVIISI
jgi:hypothetical protein